ncbi:MAG: tRNA 2-selenouridine(34) synthase MnmH [Bacillota bacterium]
MYKDITIEESIKIGNPIYVDLRSPREYELDTIPGAINVPLFNNEEREEIGIIYMEQGVQAARRRGLDFAAINLPGLIDKLSALKSKGTLVLFCWRGGDRSLAVAKLLDIMHIPCFRLIRGYHGYRQYVHKHLYKQSLPQKFLVLHGLTGVGKTEIIEKIDLDGFPVLDFESLANHRGSVFGAVGMLPQPSQKRFESLIWNKISKLSTEKTIIVEGESKKVGKLYIPDAVFQGMINGNNVFVHNKLENRINRLINIYTGDGKKDIERLVESSYYLSKKIGKSNLEKLQKLLLNGDLEQFVAILLQKYYDVLYTRSLGSVEQYDLIVDAGNLENAVWQIENLYYQLG